MIALTLAAWVAGGLLFAHAAITNPAASPVVAANSRVLVDDLFRLHPAALVALVLFVAVWPAVFVGAHVGRFAGALGFRIQVL